MHRKLIAREICKSIKGKQVLEHISLELEEGNVYGFWGRNGSGKTMLFRALSGLIRIDSGSILWADRELHKDFAVLPSLGIVLEHAGLYPNMTGVENLTYLAGFRKTAGQAEILDAIRRVGLDPEDRRVYGKYSMGMKQRLAIAQAVMEKPDVILLDEPTNGLDEMGLEAIRKLIREEKERGALVLLASHNKDDMKVLADHVYGISEGHMTGEEMRL
ncbi:MAG: ABC transporter ATP-binding protein [Clostridiales bacterium]|nr:ABC transporter ATP-binding protein [Clostridiales bacterium]